MSFAFQYIECDIPPGMTVRDWKLARKNSSPGGTQPAAVRTDDQRDAWPGRAGWVSNFCLSLFIGWRHP